jgi:hypothetical protein
MALPNGKSKKLMLFIAMSVFLGILGATSNDLSESGLLRGSQAAVVLLALLWSVYLVVSTLWSSNLRITRRIVVSIGRAGVALAIMILTWTVASPVLPDAAYLFFVIRRSYIESHWITDQRSQVQYYPLSYAFVEQGKAHFPLFFLVLDSSHSFKFVPFSDQLMSPSCPGAKYSARALTDDVYLVRAFVDDPGEKLEPCLIIPSPISE